MLVTTKNEFCHFLFSSKTFWDIQKSKLVKNLLSESYAKLSMSSGWGIIIFDHGLKEILEQKNIL